jgi:hypothetical protein
VRGEPLESVRTADGAQRHDAIVVFGGSAT